MKILIALGLAFGVVGAASANGYGYDSYGSTRSGHESGYGYTNPGSHEVSGYTKRDGTYVEPYRATNPNYTGRDNYSTSGNENPWTGKQGHSYVDK